MTLKVGCCGQVEALVKKNSHTLQVPMGEGLVKKHKIPGPTYRMRLCACCRLDLVYESTIELQTCYILLPWDFCGYAVKTVKRRLEREKCLCQDHFTLKWFLPPPMSRQFNSPQP